MKKDTNERSMSSRQKIVQMQHYWNDLAHTATDDMKKKSMKMRFGITNIKLDKKGGKLISFDEDSMREGSEWEEMFGDATYQDSYWGDPDTITGKIKKAREKAEAEAADDDEELDHKVHQQRTNESKKSYEQFVKEVRGSTAVFTFGRFNPPTIGHEKLLKVIENTATKNQGDQFIFLSQSQDAKKNPLSASLKLTFMKLMFPKQRGAFPTTSARTALEALVELHERQKYSKVIMVVGSDRVKEFDTLFNRYNDVESKHGYYKFENIDVISAGERDPDAEGASGMSASKMRAAVQEGNYDLFKMGVPSGVSESDCHSLYNAVAKGMRVRLKEEMGYDIIEMEEIYSLIDEIETLCESEESDVLLSEEELYELGLIKKMIGKIKGIGKKPGKGLTPAQRRKMAIRMKIQAKKPGFIMKRLRAMKRAASRAVIAVRARKAAIKKVIKKFFPKLRKKKKSELSYAERGKISKIVQKKAKLITRMAKKLRIVVKKRDVERRKKMSQKDDTPKKSKKMLQRATIT